jgi:hypothetical protein
VTEADWLTATGPRTMVEFLRGRASERKLRLFAVAYARHRMFGDHETIGVTERYADGLADDSELARAESAATWHVLGTCTDIQGEVTDARCWSVRDAAIANAADAARAIVWAEEDARELHQRLNLPPERSPIPDLLRDLVGNPFRPAPRVDRAWLAWNGGTVAKLAAVVYEGRDFGRLPLLADALEDAGCGDADLLGHLRGPGPHVRGCWAVDLLLGKG